MEGDSSGSDCDAIFIPKGNVAVEDILEMIQEEMDELPEGEEFYIKLMGRIIDEYTESPCGTFETVRIGR